MAQVHGADTKPEVEVRKALHAAGYRFRLTRRDLPGKPDIVLPRHKIAIFVHGCFWHGHDCKRARIPKTNTEYWLSKVARNKSRDESARRDLESLGWQVFVVWECNVSGGVEAVLDCLRGSARDAATHPEENRHDPSRR